MLNKNTFRGGVHPHEEHGGKAVTGRLPIEAGAAPKTVAILMAQHVGAPCKPIVKPGQRVRMGQIIGEPGGFVGAPVHASVSGTVKAIQTRVAANGLPAPAVIIDNDGLDEWDPSVQPFSGDPMAMDAEELKSRIRTAGVVGMGGATFPTQVKLSPPPSKPIDTVILNGAECEPYLTADHRMMLENADAIVDGLLIAMKIVSARTGVIGIETNKPDAISAMQSVCAGKGVTVKPLYPKYPQGGEKQLIHVITGRQVPSGGLPMDVGALVLNVTTAAAISAAIRKGRPVIERVVTVTGLVAQPKNLMARVGTPIVDLIAQCGGPVGGANKLVLGGPMMGLSAFSDDTPVVKGSSGVLLLRDDEEDQSQPGNCIRCGACVANCPIHLMPLTLYALSRRGLFDQANAEHAMDCIECGCCSFGCPAKLPLVHSIRVAKREIARKR